MAMLLASFEIDAVATLDGRDADEVMSFTMNPTALRMQLSVASPRAHLEQRSAKGHSLAVQRQPIRTELNNESKT
jgi:hypothetical protein